MSNLRIVDKQEGNTWSRLTLKDLVVGGVFRMYENNDTEPALGMWKVLEIPVEHNGVWGVVAEEVTVQQYNVGVAQLVEHLAENQSVAGSIPVPCTNHCKWIAQCPIHFRRARPTYTEGASLKYREVQ